MGKPNPLNSSSGGFHRGGRRKDTRKGLVSSTSSRRNTCKNKKCKTIRRRHGRKHITRKISGGGSGEMYVVVKFNDNEKPNNFKFEIDRVEYPGGSVNWRKSGKSSALYKDLVGKLKGVTGMGTNMPAPSYTPGGPPSSGMGAQGMGYGSMANNSYGNSYGSMATNGNRINGNIGMNNNGYGNSTTSLTNNGKNNGKTISNNGPKNNVDLLVDRIDNFVKDPEISKAAKNLLANVDKVKIDPSVWNNLGQYLKNNGINISDEVVKKINESLYKEGDVIVFYDSGLKIGQIMSIDNNNNITSVCNNSVGKNCFNIKPNTPILKLDEKIDYGKINSIQTEFDKIDSSNLLHDRPGILYDIVKEINKGTEFKIDNFDDTEIKKNNSLYKAGDVIVSYANLNVNDTKSNSVLRIGKMVGNIKIYYYNDGIYKPYQYINMENFNNEINNDKYYNINLTTSKEITKIDVNLNDDEIKEIQGQFNRIKYDNQELSINKNIVDKIADDIKQKKNDNELDKFNIEDFVDNQYLIDAAATGTTAIKGTIPIDGKDTTEFAIATSLIDMTAAANPGTIASSRITASPGTKASPGTTASPTNTTVEKINTNFLENFNIRNDKEKKNFIEKINNIKINDSFEKLKESEIKNNNLKETINNWRNFLTEINKTADNSKNDSDFKKFQSSGNHYSDMNKHITEEENLFNENKDMIDELIDVDFKNKAFNIAIMTKKIDKLQKYYKKLIDDIKIDNTEIDRLIKEYDNNNSMRTKFQNTFIGNELAQIKNLTGKMKKNSDYIINFSKKLNNKQTKVSKNIEKIDKLLYECVQIMKGKTVGEKEYMNIPRIKSLIDKYKLEQTTNSNNLVLFIFGS